MDLFYLNGEQRGESYPLTPPGVSIGREVDNDLQLLIGKVSRYHAMISFDGSDWYIEDIGSTNGTFVQKQKITVKTKLSPGDEIRIGDQLFRIGEDDPAPAKNVKEAAAKTSVFKSAPLYEVAPAPEPEPVPNPDLASQIRKSRHSIFGGTPSSGKENKTGKKKSALGNIIFTLIVITLPLICILGYMVMMERSNMQKQKPVPQTGKQPFLLYYEKTVVTPDNVFRFETKVEDNVAVFTLDDLKYGRHNVVKQGNLKEEQIEQLKDSIRQTGFMKLSNEATNTPTGPQDERRVIAISLDSHFNQVEVRNTYAQTSFEDVEKAISDFAELFDVRIDSMTEEEMRAEARNTFRRAEELLANYQASPENIRNAILRYKNAMKYYEQFEPKPREWDICRKQLIKAEEIYKRIHDGLIFNIQKFYKLRQYDKASQECKKMLDLVDPDSSEYQKYKRYKVIFDRQLRRKK